MRKQHLKILAYLLRMGRSHCRSVLTSPAELQPHAPKAKAKAKAKPAPPAGDDHVEKRNVALLSSLIIAAPALVYKPAFKIPPKKKWVPPSWLMESEYPHLAVCVSQISV